MSSSIRTRLMIAFVAAVSLTAVALSMAYTAVGFQNSRQQVLDSLDVVANLKESQLDAWVGEMQDDLASLVLEEESPIREQARLLLAPHAQSMTAPKTSQIKDALRSALRGAVRQGRRFTHLMAISREGEIVVASDPAQEGRTLSDERYFQMGIRGPYIHPPFKPSVAEQVSLIAAQPISDQYGNVIGVLAGHVSLAAAEAMMSQRSGLGRTGRTYLVDSDYAMLTASGSEDNGESAVHSQGIDTVIEDHADGSATYVDYRGVPVIGVFRWLPDLRVGLLIEQAQSEAFDALYQALILNTGVAVFFVLLAVVGSQFLTRSIATPLADLAETAAQIAAGDLAQVAKAEREDEIGMLARSFNSMTARLRDLIDSLERRVADRTSALERRAVLLATAADVGRAAASILEPEPLTRQVVDLVRKRFDLYYVGLFLLDEAGEYAVLEAGTGAAGRSMQEQGHRLAVGGVSMVGSACAQRQARIALDAGEEAVRFDNPLLPNTRSKMALPLMVGDRVLGAIDIQSTHPNAFSEEDIAVLQLVVDQVAVAIDNAHKFSEEARLLEATSPLFRASRRLATAVTTDDIAQAIVASVAETEADGCVVGRLDLLPDGRIESATFVGAWDRDDERGFPAGVSFPASAAPFPLQMVTTSWTTGDITQVTQIPKRVRQFLSQFGGQALVNVPLRAGDRVIGFVSIYRATADPFSAVSVQLYQTLADQAAVALERARLVEEAQLRASHERLVSRTAARMRETLDVETVLRTAVREIGVGLELHDLIIELDVNGHGAEDGVVARSEREVS